MQILVFLYSKTNIWVLFLILIGLLSIAYFFETNYITDPDRLHEQAMNSGANDHVSEIEIENIAKSKAKTLQIIYLAKVFLIPFFSFVFAVFLQGMIKAFSDSEEISNKKLYRVVLISYLLVGLAEMLKGIYFSVFKSGYTIQQYDDFRLASLGNLIDVENTEAWLVGLAYHFNLFELFFILSITFGLEIAFPEKNIAKIGFFYSLFGFGLVILIIIISK